MSLVHNRVKSMPPAVTNKSKAKCLPWDLDCEWVSPDGGTSDDGGITFTSDKANYTRGRNFMTKIRTNPRKFVEEVQKLNPESIKEIISLLEDLRATSYAREKELKDDLSTKTTQLDDAKDVMVDASDALDKANQAVTDAKGALSEREAEASTAHNNHEDAKEDHASKLTAKNNAKELHDQEVPSLDDEQRILTDVLDMMGGLHNKYAGKYTTGICQPTGKYTMNECCAPGYRQIVDTDECTAAASAVGQPRNVDTVWDHRPKGCFWHVPNGNVYFNTYAMESITQNMIGDDKVLCIEAAEFAVGTCQPTGTYEIDECCSPGYTTITTSADCTKAQATLAISGSNIGGDHGWDHRPAGCFWHQPNKYFHFNTLTKSGLTQNMIGDDKVICKLID